MLDIIAVCLLCVLSAGLGGCLTAFLIKKFLEKEFHALFQDEAKQFADEIFNDASAMLEDKINDSDMVDTLLAELFKSLRQQFAASKATSTRQQNAASKRIVDYFLKQAPMANLILEESGAKEYFEKNPSLLIWGMETFPGLFNLGGGATSETPNLNIPNTPSPPPPPPIP